jgi:hypothetical protein
MTDPNTITIITDAIPWLGKYWVEILAGYFALQQLAKIIVKLTATKKDDAVLAKISNFIDSVIVLHKTK